jgi:hypothetical protein
MTIDAAVWCIACGKRPDVALTIDYGGTLAHYGACWDHVATVALRARSDLQGARQAPLRAPVADVRGTGAIEAQADG